jgi:hypothetical protein
MGGGGGMTVYAHLLAQRGEEQETIALPYVVSQMGAAGRPVECGLLPGIKLTLHAMSVEQSIIRLLVDEPGAEAKQRMAVEVSTKPLIGLLWAGTILLGVGCTVALLRRYRSSR